MKYMHASILDVDNSSSKNIKKCQRWNLNLANLVGKLSKFEVHPLGLREIY